MNFIFIHYSFVINFYRIFIYNLKTIYYKQVNRRRSGSELQIIFHNQPVFVLSKNKKESVRADSFYNYILSFIPVLFSGTFRLNFF